jgi:hypothetical protein
VTFDGHRTNDFTPYVYVTEDGGDSFWPIASNLPTGSVDFVHVIEEDPHNENLLFVGTDVGAYVSTDRGGTWQRFMNGLPTVPVHDLEVHPRDGELIAGTHGRSIWVVDITPLQHMDDEVMASEAALMPPKPGLQFGYPPRGGEYTAHQWWSRPTPGANAEISYFISESMAASLAAADSVARAEAAAAAAAAADTSQTAAPDSSGTAGAAAQAMAAGRRPGGPGARAAGGRGMPGMGGMGRSRGPTVSLKVTDADGNEVNSLTGPASAGLHKVTWNMRGKAPERSAASPSEMAERREIGRRAEIVVDSLREAGGWPEMLLGRVSAIFTGQVPMQQLMSMFGGGPGGGGGSRDPEAFRARPGESFASGSQMGFGQMRELGEMIMPGQGIGSIFRRAFGGGGGAAEMVEPGTYTITLVAGDVTSSHSMTIERHGQLTGNSSPFEAEWERFLRRMDRMR